MNARRAYAGIAVICACFIAVAARRWRLAAAAVSVSTDSVPSLGTIPRLVVADSLATAQDRIATNDPFRLSNTPASVRYDPRGDAAPNSGSSSATISPPRPTLVLKAIVGGPPWQAIIDGLPGQPPGAVVHSGASFDRLTIRAVTRDSVIVRSPDTAWVLRFRERT